MNPFNPKSWVFFGLGSVDETKAQRSILTSTAGEWLSQGLKPGLLDNKQFFTTPCVYSKVGQRALINALNQKNSWTPEADACLESLLALNILHVFLLCPT